ncbi:MAG TPA: hypothetical protein VGP79_04780 [Bryobacteraceae bacterium]|jgi:hypothetical protein|nr:hypothetical protein [Bryobacteraceae bacterium]
MIATQRPSSVAALASAPLLALVLYWRAFVTWFADDDFAWLGQRLGVLDLSSLASTLFDPSAQGTVRVLSERVFFLVLSSLFGLHPLPYRIVVFVTWIAALCLVNRIAARLTGSQLAGVVAALLCAANPNIIRPLTWASAYNQVLCAFLLLTAFYAHLRWLESGERKWIVAEWAAYLAGFGALEIIVMYPALMLLYHLCAARRKWFSVGALAVPAVAFAAVHAFLIPKTGGAIYDLSIDARVFSTLAKYVAWTLGPSRMGGVVAEAWRIPGYIATVLVGISLAIFVVSRLRRREWLVIFYLGWFVLLIAPVLTLPNHITDYYVASPAIGFCWLGGWAFATAWRSGMTMRAVAVVLATLFLAGAAAEITCATTFFYQRSRRMQSVLTTMRDSLRGHPDSIVVIRGVDNDLFHSGFQDEPFRLVGAKQVFLFPGTEARIQARAELGGIEPFKLSEAAMLDALRQNHARILDAGPAHTRDITEPFKQIKLAEQLAQHRNFVDVGDQQHAPRLGPQWYPIENGFRWMPKLATVRIAGPKTTQDKLYVTGYSAPAALASNPVMMHFRIGEKEIGKTPVSKFGEQFVISFPLPAELIGQYEIELTIEVSKTFKPPNDQRELGMIFGTFEIK